MNKWFSVIAAAMCILGEHGRCQAADAKAPHLISVASPAYCSEVKGDTPIDLVAPGWQTVVVKCWQQGEGFGSDSTVGEVKLDDSGKGSIVFPA